MTGDPQLRSVSSHGFNDINIKSIMTVLDNKPLKNAHIKKKEKNDEDLFLLLLSPIRAHNTITMIYLERKM